MIYIKTISDFLKDDSKYILQILQTNFAEAEKSQVDSWKVLIDDFKNSNLHTLNQDSIIGIEYPLPIDGMGIDALIVGQDKFGRKHAFIVESKQWTDSNIYSYRFGESRSEDQTLHPQIQVSRHALALKDYTNVGVFYDVHPVVFMRNASHSAIFELQKKNPNVPTANIPVFNQMNDIVKYFKSIVDEGSLQSIEDFETAYFKPSKSIISAMESIANRYEPFLLTKEQEEVVKKIFSAFSNGKKIIRVTGAAGSGKTAILLHVYIKLLNRASDEVRPIFISGAQNTKLYQSLFSQVEKSFTFSYSLKNMVGKTIGYKYFICMDEAQHNDEGIISEMINRGAKMIICYDPGQVINANNSLRELNELEKREDFLTIKLHNSVRYSGSQVFESNVKRLLDGNLSLENDDKFDFQVFDRVEDLIAHTKRIILDHPNDTVAVTGLLSKNAKVIAERPNSQIFIKWGYLGEKNWIPYIQGRNYLNQYGGNLWVGTWWLPGLDVDYISVIVGNDAKLTDSGLNVDLNGVMHYKMLFSVAEKMNFPQSLFVTKMSFGKQVTDNERTSDNIAQYLRDHPEVKETFTSHFTTLLKNNYYILLTRGRKGCYVCFTNK